MNRAFVSLALAGLTVSVSATWSLTPVSATLVPPTSEPAEIADSFPPVEDASRIIPVNGDIAEVVYALDLGDQIVATDISATYPDEANATPKIGYQQTLTAETILAFEPTVVIADDRAGPPEVFDAIRAAGVDVVIIQHHADLQAPAYKIRAIASTLDVTDAGETLVTTFEDELAAGLAVADAGVSASGRPLVLALYFRGEGVQLVFGAGSGIDAIVEAAGAVNAGTEMGVVDNGELSTESIIDAAPDYLLVTTTGLASVGGVDGLLAQPGLAETPAGEHRRVLVFEDQFLYGLGPRMGQLVASLAEQIHAP